MHQQNNVVKLSWDILIIILSLITCVVIPLFLASDNLLFPRSFIYVLDVFFLVNILITFKTAQNKNIHDIEHQGSISKHYLKRSFATDLISTLPFDLLFIASSVSIFNFPLYNILLLLRLTRLIKANQILNLWKSFITFNSDYIRLIKFFLFVGISIHFIACFWIVMHLLETDSKTWLSILGIANADFPTQYIRSLYWTVTTLTTVGYGDITPQNNIEYVFTSITMLLGASFYAFFIGNIAALFSNINAEKTAFWKRIEVILLFLNKREPTKFLSEKVRTYYDYIWEKYQGVSIDALVKDLPESLKNEINHVLLNDLLNKVPIFIDSPLPLRKKLVSFLQLKTYSPGIKVVDYGEISHEIFFITNGQLQILNKDDKPIGPLLEEGDYFGHMSLILQESRTCSVIAQTFSEVFVLTEECYKSLKDQYPEFSKIMKESSAKNTKFANMIIDDILL